MSAPVPPPHCEPAGLGCVEAIFRRVEPRELAEWSQSLPVCQGRTFTRLALECLRQRPELPHRSPARSLPLDRGDPTKVESRDAGEGFGGAPRRAGRAGAAASGNMLEDLGRVSRTRGLLGGDAAGSGESRAGAKDTGHGPKADLWGLRGLCDHAGEGLCLDPLMAASVNLRRSRPGLGRPAGRHGDRGILINKSGSSSSGLSHRKTVLRWTNPAIFSRSAEAGRGAAGSVAPARRLEQAWSGEWRLRQNGNRQTSSVPYHR